jgi:hypothetical protein
VTPDHPPPRAIGVSDGPPGEPAAVAVAVSGLAGVLVDNQNRPGGRGHSRTAYNVELLAIMIERTTVGIAHQFPMARYRMMIVYRAT